MLRPGLHWCSIPVFLVLLCGNLSAQVLTILTGDQSVAVGAVEIPLAAAGGSGSGYTWSLAGGSLPPGLAIRTDVPQGWQVPAAIVGVATTPGSYAFTLEVKDSLGNTATKLITVKVHNIVMTSPVGHWELPDGAVGVPYNQRVAAIGGSGPLSFSVCSGSLPPGLTLNGSTGAIIGTPSSAGAYDVDICITDGTDTIRQGRRITVSPLDIITPAQLPNAQQGAPYTQAIQVAGGSAPYTFEASCCLPPGLSLSSSGVISGVPGGPGYWAFTVTVKDASGASARRNFALGVAGSVPGLPSIQPAELDDIPLGAPMVVLFEAQGGTPPYTWSVTSGTLPPGAVLLEPSAVPPNIPANRAVLTAATNTPGTYIFTLSATDSSVPPRTASRSFTLRISTLSVDPMHWLPGGQLGAPYAAQFRFLGGGASPSYTATLVRGALHTGLTMDSSGRVQGIPVESQVRRFVLRASESTTGAELVRQYALDVASGSPAQPCIEDGELWDAPVNQPYSRQLNAGCGSEPFTWGLEAGSSLPPGLTLSPAGVLSGTPVQTGKYTFLVRATDKAGNFAVRSFRLEITPVRITSNTELPYANQGSSYTAVLSATGGTGPLTWSVTPGSRLPGGLTLTPGGVLSGTPNDLGSSYFQLTVTDAAGFSSTRTFHLPIYPPGAAPPLTITTGDQTWRLGLVMAPLEATGGTGAYTWSLVSCPIPGVALRTDVPQGWTATAGLMGVATSAGTYSCTVQVASGGQTATKTLNIRVAAIVVGVPEWLADASVGVFYRQRILAWSASGPLSFALPPGAQLPPGLTLDPATGEIAGTPVVPGSYYFEVNISDSSATIGHRVGISVSPMRILSPSALPNATQNVPYMQTISVAGGTPPYTFGIHCCAPGWLTLNPATGVLGGTPDYPGFWGFVVVIRDSAGAELRQHFTLGVVGAPLSSVDMWWFLDDQTLGEPSWQSVATWGGTPPYQWSLVSGSLPPGISLQDPSAPPLHWSVNGAMLAGAPGAPGLYTFAVQAVDSSVPSQTSTRLLNLRVSALSLLQPRSGSLGVPYAAEFPVLGGTPPYSFTILEGRLPQGLAMTGAGQISGTPQETGWCFWLRLKVTDAAGNSITRGQCLQINGPSAEQVYVQEGFSHLGQAAPGQSYQRQLTASGGWPPYTWSLEPGSALPGSLALSPAGLISGTAPAAAGDYVFTVRVTDSQGNFGLRVLRLRVTPLSVSVSTLLPYANVGAAYSTSLGVQGAAGAVAWSLSPGHALPPGLSLNPSTGVISGTPAAAGNYFFELTATDSTGAATSALFTLPVFPSGVYPPVAITTAPDLGTSSIGHFQVPLTATGGTGSYTWSLVGGTLPPGVSLRADKSPSFPEEASAGLSGLATTPGTYTFTLRASSGGQSATRTFTARIVSLTIKDDRLPDAFVGVPFSYTFSSAGGESPLTWSVQQGTSLPQGLALDAATGTLQGVPAAPGTYQIGISMTHAGITVGRTFELRVWAIRITSPGLLPNATQGVPYEYQLAAQNCTGGCTWSLSGWAPPPGITLHPDGRLSGTPQSPGTWHFNITATDTAGRFCQKHFSLNVVGVPAILPGIITPSNLDDFSLGRPQTMTFKASGGTAPYTWTAAGLPPGLSLRSGDSVSGWETSPADAEIWGTPAQPGTYAVTLTLADAAGNVVSRAYTLRVSVLQRDPYAWPPPATRGQPYSTQLRMIGGTPPYTWQLVPGTGRLPAGLTLDSSTGVISGTPLENTWTYVQVRVTDAASNSHIQTVSLAIGGGTSTVAIPEGWDLGSITLNEPWSHSLNACCVPAGYTWSVEPGSTLPPGLSLNPATGMLSGTPAAAGTYWFLLRAADLSNPANYGVLQFRLNVTPLRVTSDTTLPWTNAGAAYSAAISYTGNAGPVTFALAPGSSLPAGLTLTPGGLISGTPAATGSFSFDVTLTDPAGNTWRTVNFRISIYPPGAAPPLYLDLGPELGPQMVGQLTYQLNASGGKPPYTYSYAPGATPIPGVRVQTGPPLPEYFSAGATGGLLGIVTTPGAYTTTIRVTDSSTPPQVFDRTITLRISALSIPAQHYLTEAAVSEPYSFTFTASGGTGNYAWSATNPLELPSGISLSSAGVLGGTPTAPGEYYFHVKVIDSAGESLIVGYRLVVRPFSITTAGLLPPGTVNAPYSIQLAADAPVSSWRIVDRNLPAGLTLNAATGLISGTPTATFHDSFTVEATGPGGQTVRKIFTLRIDPSSPQPLAIWTGSDLGDVQVGGNFRFSLVAFGGQPPYTWEVEPGSALPPGLSLITNCDATLSRDCPPGFTHVAGVPREVGSYSFTLRVRDSAGSSLTRTFSMNVTAVWPFYWSLPLPGGSLVYGVPYSQALLAIGGSGSYTWTADTALPAGLALSPAGLLSGTPAATGTYQVRIRITDTNGLTAARSTRISIVAGTPVTLSVSGGPDLGTVSQGWTSGWTFSASGSPLAVPNYTWSLTGTPPPGCALLAGDAAPAGTPANSARLVCSPFATGAFSFGVRAQDSSGNFGVAGCTLRVTPNTIYTSSSDLTPAVAGSAYSHQFLAWGASQTWTLASGSSLPPGLSLSPSGLLSGTPTSPGVYSFSLSVTDASGFTVTNSYTMRVSSLAITDPPVLPVQAISGQPFSYTFTAVGGGPNKSWAITSGSLPTGITFNAATATLSGTTAAPGLYSFFLRVSDGTYEYSRRFTLVVRDPYPGLLTFSLASTQLGDVPLGQNYSMTLTPSGGVAPYQWSLAPGSSLPPGIALYPPEALGQRVAPHQWMLAGVPTVPGPYSFTLRVTDSTGATMERTFQMNVRTLNIASISLRQATYGVPYSQAISALGGTPPFSFSLLSGRLPEGLSLSPSGLISGTPANTGYWSFTVACTDSTGASISRSFQLFVAATTPKTLDITTTAELTDRSVGVRTNMFLGVRTVDPATGATTDTGPYTWSLAGGALPPGLALVPGSAISPSLPATSTYLAGAPAAPGLYTFTLKAADSTAPAPNIGYKTFTLRVSPLQVLSASSYLDATAGVPFSFTLLPAGGTPPHAFALAPRNYLPPGVTLGANGILSGATSLTGSFTFSFDVTDASGASLRTSRTLRVTPAGKAPPLTLVTEDALTLGLSLTEGSEGQNYAGRISLNDSVSSAAWPVTWTLQPGSSLPQGMSLIAGDATISGNLAGAPAASGSYSFRLRATDSAGQSVVGTYRLTVSPLGLSPYPLPAALVGLPYSVTLTPSGGTPPYGIQLAYYSSLPPGLTFSGGALSGTPTVAGRFAGAFIVTDSAGNTLTKAYVIDVDSAVTPLRFLSLAPRSLQITYALGETPPAAEVHVSSGPVPVNFTAAVAGIPGASLTLTSGTTPATTTLVLPAGLAAGAYYGLIQINSAQSPNSPQVVRVMVTVTPPPPCAFTLTPSASTIGSEGGAGSVVLSAGSSCSWSASVSDPSILTLTSPSSGVGSAVLSYAVAANPGASSRTASITVQGAAPPATHTVTQFGSSCAITIDPLALSVPASGGSGVISIAASHSSCSWSASSSVSWITVAQPAGGTGSGTVTIQVAANTAAASRTGTVTVNGQTLTVNQAGAACITTLSSGGVEMPAAGGSGTVNVSLPQDCSYSTLVGPSWITVTSGAAGSGPGGTLSYSVAPNSSTSARTGSLLIGGQPFQITQAGVACSFSIAADNPVFPSAGGTGSVSITASAPACAWSASSSAGWLTFPAGASGSGSGVLSFTLAVNPSPSPRQAALTVAGQTLTITQAGAQCSYSLLSLSATVPATGGSGSVGVAAAQGCAWTASSNAAWLILNQSSGNGSGEVLFTALPNTGASERTGTLAIAGQTFTVTQPGQPCLYTLDSESAVVAPAGGTGSFAFSSTAAGCTPSAVSFAGWISVSTSFSGTSGTVSFTAQPNPSGAERAGIIQLGTRTFTVRQTASSCAFSLDSYGASFGNAGGSGQVLASASAWGCTPAVGASPEITLGPLSGPVNSIWTQPYSVPRFDFLTAWIRQLYISISGQLFTIKQTSWP